MSFTLRVLLGLLAGFAVGTAAGHYSWAAWTVPVVEPLGIIFVNAIRLAVIPLVVASLIVGCATAGDARRIGRLAGRALVVILVILTAAAATGTLASMLVLSHLPPATTAPPPAPTAAPPSLTQWFIDLVPANVFKAAADAALLPLVVFSIAFGLALTGIEESRRTAVVEFFRTIYDAFMVLIRVVVAWTPLGVFALIVPLAAKLGASAVRDLAAYIVFFCVTAVAFIVLVLYPAAAWLGGVGLARFARACAAAQAVAFTARSSLAALPAIYEGARDELHLRPEIVGFYVPLGASVFRAGGAIAQTTGVIFLAHLAGVTLTPSQLLTATVAAVLTSLTIPGIPGGGILVMAPVLTAVHVPEAGIGILLAIDAIPDMFRTTGNVVGQMAGACILDRWMGRVSESASAAAASE